jgi:hypothetical protein
MKMSEGEITTTVYGDLKDMLEDLSLTIPVFKTAFPKGQSGEYVVVGTIGNTLIGEQVATVNVNIYVPDKLLTINGVSQRVRDNARIDSLTAELLEVIDNYTGENSEGGWYRYYKTNQSVISEEDINYSFSNIQLTFKNN